MTRFRFTNPKLQMTPMIDVVFLLLIFFMISTTFIRRSPDRLVKPPRARQLGDRTGQGRALVLNVRRNGSVTLDGRVLSADKLDKTIRAAAGPVIIRADARARHLFTLRILRICARAGRKKVRLVVLQSRK